MANDQWIDGGYDREVYHMPGSCWVIRYIKKASGGESPIASTSRRAKILFLGTSLIGIATMLLVIFTVR